MCTQRTLNNLVLNANTDDQTNAEPWFLNIHVNIHVVAVGLANGRSYAKDDDG